MANTLNKSIIVRLLCRCIDHENTTDTPAKRKYWFDQYRRFRALAVRIGWID